MATTNLITNVNRGLERIENHIRGVGTPMQNPANIIDGIRAERDQYQNILNDENRQAERITQMHTNALNNEMEARREYWQLAQNRQERIGELLRKNFVFQLIIQRKDTQIAEHRRNAHRLTGQILALQNNPLGNMAAVHEIYQMLAPALGQVPNYIGQEQARGELREYYSRM
ncbi:hypothetical protein RhiirC2_722134 [Rhizophagus irregularis]|uniref:Uncharacterized protein n=1 Tax=Rhizophagus irregularis TaxID=588596 RepID=A0A2N1M2Z4_9GLOM|nr:hypothetical protein RhiirC2_722134 [Rhizophagus irregularis]